MPANYNIDPYFDDFNKTKNFMRVLFRPGRAVQARELTQAQTILQNQISAMSSTIFKENSRVIGAELSIKTNKVTLVLHATDSNSLATDVNILKGFRIQDAANSATQATITDIDVVNKRVLLDIHGGIFTSGASIQTIDPVTGTPNTNVSYLIDSTHNSMIAHINDGIVFVGGNFVNVTASSYVVDSSSSMSTKEFIVGYIVNEKTVDSITDVSLVDNATGSFNFNAPGADRIEVQIVLSGYEVTRNAAGVETSITPPNFNKIMLIKNGVVLDDLIQNIKYSDIIDLLARRTSAESGNYITEQYPIDLKESTNPANVVVSIGAGTAFIEGYENINQLTQNIEIPKSREFTTANNQQYYFAAGAYFELTSFVGIFNVTAEESVTLYNSVDGTGTAIGTANILSVVNNNFGEQRVYLQNYENALSAFSSVGSIVGSTSNALGVVKVDLTNKPIHSVNSKADGIVDIYGDSSANNIKSVPAISVSHDVVKNFDNVAETAAGSKVYVISAPDTTTDFYVSNGVYALAKTSTGAALTSPADYSVTSVSNQNGGISTMTITMVALQGAISLIVPLYKSVSPSRLKILHKNVVQAVTSNGSGIVTLANYDILNFVSVADVTNPASPVTISASTYTTNNGQTDWNYGVGSISGLVANTNYSVVVDHFTHSTSGDYFSVDSYMSSPANIDPITGFLDLYSRIGNYVSSNNTTYKLINCLDTRQTLANTAASDKFAVESQNLQINYDYYIGRIDKIYTNKSGIFDSSVGISSANPQEPKTPTGSLDLAMVYIPPYTHNAFDCVMVVYNNRRYTMPDISKLDLRLRNLEDYVSYGLLEKTADSMIITDANGLNRYKNGIFVDNFMTHINGSTADPSYNISVDNVQGGLVPKQQENFNALISRTANQVNISEQRNITIPALSADTATLSYIEKEFISQKANSNSTNVNPYAAVVWHGQVSINPSSDIWVDTAYLPGLSNTSGSVVSASSTSTTNTAIKDEYSIDYNPWNYAKDPAVMAGIRAQIAARKAQGIPHANTAATNWANIKTAFAGEKQTSGWVQVGVERERTSTATTATTQVIPTTTASSVDKSVSLSSIAMMRAKSVNYHLSGMRPNQTLVATFDGVDVTANISNNTAAVDGSCTGIFSIPAGVFRVGTRVLKFFDAAATTDASTSYSAQGTLNTRQITTTTIRSSFTTTTYSTASTTTGSHKAVWLDPIAQSFLPIPDNGAIGVFISSVDLFFKTKATNLPVSIFIVPTANGIPTQNIIPLSEVSINPSGVNVSANGFTATNFKFEAPVYLEANVEYAIVITSNSNNYSVWYAKQGEPTLLNQIGQTETNRGGLATSKQPYLGVMFKSQNSSTWTEDQTADLKFVLNRCEFNTASGTLYFDTEDLSVATGNGNEGMSVARYQPNIHTLSVAGTDVQFEYSDNNGTTWNKYQDLDKIYVSETVLSTVGGIKPFSTRLTLTTNNSWVSPMIDLNRAGYATSINLFGANNEGGTYISKSVQLKNPALDMRVLIDLLEPAGSNVDVFFSTQTPQVPKSATNTALTFKAGITNTLVGVDVFVYHREAITGALTKVGGFLPTKIDSALTFASNISNVDMFVAPGSSTTYATVDKVFYTNISNLTTAPNWAAGSHNIGTYVFHNNALWKALATNTASPVVNSVSWQEIPMMSTTDSLTTNTAIVWRPMHKEATLPGGVDPSANFYTYTMIPDSVVEEPFDKFVIKVVLKSTNNAVTPIAQNLRAVAAT